jgi:hypothetical protein
MFLKPRARLAARCCAWLLCGLAIAGCGRRLESDECDALLNHYTEKLLRVGSPSLPAAEIVLRQERVRVLARERPEFEFHACASKVSRRQFECALAAATVDEIERCLM